MTDRPPPAGSPALAPTRTKPRRDALVDRSIAATLLVCALLTVFIANDLELRDAPAHVPLWAEYALTVALMAPLAWRRRFPLTVLVAVGVMFSLYRLAGVYEVTASSIALFLALFTAGAQSEHPARDRIRGAVVGMSMVLVLWFVLDEQDYVGLDQLVFSTFAVAQNAAFFIAGWLLGDAQRTRRRNEAELKRRAEQLAAEREERARRAVLDERVRIARELHDVVAHHVSVMGVQAAGAQRVLGSDPQRAATALAAVEESGRQAVSELQRLVGFLREGDTPQGDPSEGTHPQPTLEDLDRLVASAGLPARLQWIGRPRPVPSSVALSAYRIVQESLTNVLKHAGPVATTVIVTYTTVALQVEVRNERGAIDVYRARGNGAAINGSGRGLLGMRERVAMLGGRFDHGAAEGGGYHVLAVLPTSDAYDREVPVGEGGRQAAGGRGSVGEGGRQAAGGRRSM
jgi:signal transduction histidine kinase